MTSDHVSTTLPPDRWRCELPDQPRQVAYQIIITSYGNDLQHESGD
ncbi:MAG: hypothetical protein QF785_03945 [Phycisphaeraceae bacterium]|nr:hypothetical protein [Phycisphaeraceae bacterium]